jgi:hypothetical protein
MAFRYIPGNSQYEYDNAPPDPGVGHPMRSLWQKSANGIRTEHGQSNYVRCRRIGSGDVDHGEISKSYWDLRSSVSPYAILALEPSLILDFKASVFNKNGVSSTFGAYITHAATTNATMVDSDGLLKWRPHNLMTKSNTFSTWTKNSTVVDNSAVSPNGIANTASTVNFSGTGSYLYNLAIFAVNAGDKVTLAAWVRSDTITSITFATNGRTNGANNLSEANLAVTSTWTLVSFESTVAGNDTGLYFMIGKYSPTSPASQIGTFEAYGAHMFRSDLGGMVTDPDASTGFESYVPTTTSAVYLSRRGHHHYNGSAWVNEGILHESEARTNLMIYSGDLADATGWTGQATTGTVTAGSPFGTYQTISPTQTSSNLGPAQRYQIGNPITSGSTYVGWALAKYSAGSGWFVVNMYDTGHSNEQAFFDLQNGVVGSKQPLIIDHGMVDYGDGWWLCWASSNAASGSGGLSLEVPNGDGVQSCTATDVILIAGSQFELGATPSSYIPTGSAAATRAAETLTVPAANLPYNSTNMSIQMDGKMTYADTGASGEVQQYRWQLNSTNYIFSYLSALASRSGQPIFAQRQSTSGYDEVFGVITAYSPDTNVPFNRAARHGSTFVNGAHEGTLLTANTTPTILPDLSATDLQLGYTFMGTIGQFRMWDEDITDAGITEAST